MRKLQNKKASFNMLVEFILIVAVVAVVAILVFELNDDSRETITSEDRATATIVNETITTVSTVGYDSLASSRLREATCTISACINSSNSVLISAGNYTSTGCNVKKANVTTTGGVGFNNTDWKCTYTVAYALDTVRYNATLDNDTAMSKIPKRLPLLATAIIFGVVIFVILRVIPVKLTGTGDAF